MKKEKKIGVRFKETASGPYCVVTYNQRNTTFPYEVDINLGDNFEEEFIRKSIKYLIQVKDTFGLKGIKNAIYELRNCCDQPISAI